MDPWHEFCRDRGNLQPVATIFSVLSDVQRVDKQEPVLEMTSGPWLAGQVPTIPEPLLERVQALIHVSS